MLHLKNMNNKKENLTSKHIVFVIGGMDRGGAERVISILANQYAKDGWQVDIIMLLEYVVKYELDERIRLFGMIGKASSRIRNVPKWICHIRNYLKTENPDVVVSFVARINIIVLIAALGLKQRVIISERNDPAKDGRSKIIDIVASIVYPKAERIVFQTERAKNYFGKKIQEKGIIITNPIAITAVANEKPSKKIVTVGRLAPQKNHKMLIRVFADFVEKYPEYQLWIYGEGPLRRELEEYIILLNMQERIFLPGNVDNVHKEIADAEMFVLCSDYEGLSNALLEAMMMGIPCVSTDCAGSDEYIIDGHNGILVPVGNSEKLMSSILALISDKKLRESLAKNGQDSVQKCRSEHVTMQWKQVLSRNNNN